MEVEENFKACSYSIITKIHYDHYPTVTYLSSDNAYWQGQFERAVLQTLCCSNGKVCSIEYQNEQY